MDEGNKLEQREAPVGEGAIGPSEPDPLKARSGMSLVNLAHGLKLVALLLFLLPWVTVSCAEQTLVSLSGTDLATGAVTVTNPMTGELSTPKTDGEADIPVALAALLIAATLVLGLVWKREMSRTLSMAGLAAAAALISYSVLYRVPARAREGATAESAPGISQAQIAELIRVEIAPAFWLTLGALLGAILLTYLAKEAGGSARKLISRGLPRRPGFR
jgi:hypothetical protein